MAGSVEQLILSLERRLTNVNRREGEVKAAMAGVAA